MDTTPIYENIMMSNCFNRLKAVRDGWRDKEKKTNGLDTIINIGGSDYKSYNFIMNQCYSIIVDMIPNLVIELMKAHNIVAQYYKIDQYDAHIFSVKENENWPEYVEQPNRKNVFAFSCKGDQKEGLYIFKEYGMGNRIPGTLLETIKSENGIKLHCYVSLVEENAYSEVISVC